MLKPQQRGELLLRDSLPVFGKPWFWQRSRGAMESSRSLAHVIMEMRDEIKKLEAENRELRGGCSQRPFGGLPGEVSPLSASAGQLEGMEENPYLNLRRNASAPALEGKYKGELRELRGLIRVQVLFCFYYIYKKRSTNPAASLINITHNEHCAEYAKAASPSCGLCCAIKLEATLQLETVTKTFCTEINISF